MEKENCFSYKKSGNNIPNSIYGHANSQSSTCFLSFTALFTSDISKHFMWWL